jgi:hypothetical protein
VLLLHGRIVDPRFLPSVPCDLNSMSSLFTLGTVPQNSTLTLGTVPKNHLLAIIAMATLRFSQSKEIELQNLLRAADYLNHCDPLTTTQMILI